MTPVRNAYSPKARNASAAEELNVPHRPIPKRRGFTFVGVVVAVACLAVLAGVLFPIFEKARERERLALAGRVIREIVLAMDQVFLDDGEYPMELTDPRLLNYLFPQVAEIILSDSNIYPYFILSVRPGVKDEPETWDFRVFAGIGTNPVKFTGTERGTDRGQAGHSVDFREVIESATIYRHGAIIDRAAGPGEDLYWWPFEEGTPAPTGALPNYDLTISLVIGRAAALATPLLESNPNVAKQVRALLRNPEFTALVLQEFDPTSFAAFDDILQLTDAELEDLSDLDVTMLEGDPAFLFSFESLRMLSALHVSEDEVLLGLLAKLNAAEASELRGNLKARAGQLGAFRNQVRAETGHAIPPDAARTILAICSTL